MNSGPLLPDPPFGTVPMAASWLKRCLQSWDLTHRASAYHPFESAFRPNLNPHEILYAIYLSLSEGQAIAAQANIRAGVAALIGEPELLKWHPGQLLELIRLGGQLGSVEILHATTELMRGSNLIAAEAPPKTTATLVASEIFHVVVTAGFTGEGMLAFLRACRRHAQTETVDPSQLMVMLARADRKNWASYAINLAPTLENFHLQRLEGEAAEQELRFFSEDLLSALEDGDDENSRSVQQGWAAIAKSPECDRLLFMFSLRPIADVLLQVSDDIGSLEEVTDAPPEHVAVNDNNAYQPHLLAAQVYRHVDG